MTPIEICIALLGAIELSNIVLHFQNRKIMATTAEIIAKQAALQTSIDRAVPIIRDSGQRIDPAALDPIAATIDRQKGEIDAVLPPQ